MSVVIELTDRELGILEVSLLNRRSKLQKIDNDANDSFIRSSVKSEVEKIENLRSRLKSDGYRGGK